MKIFGKKISKDIKNTFKDLDKPLLIVTIVLFIFGLLNIVTASSREAVARYNDPLYYYFIRQLWMLGVGVVASYFILKIDTKRYKPLATIAFMIIFAISFYLLIEGVALKGSKNWITILNYKFQPSEFAKPIIIVSLALLFEIFYKKLRDKEIDKIDTLGLILFVGLSIPAIVFLQKDLGTAMIMAAIFFVMFLASPILKKDKFNTIILLSLVVLIAGATMMATKGQILSNEQMNRFDFINPCSNYETGGYQICNGYIAINDGGFFGLGIGKSKQKYSYIPEPHTDSVFAIIAEEYGLVRSAPIFLAFLFVLKRILDLASKANTLRGKYICLGVATYIFMHIFVNLGGLFGVLPLTGVPLPFLSYGGSFAISLVVSLAIVQRIHIETRNEKIRL